VIGLDLKGEPALDFKIVSKRAVDGLATSGPTA
jgi:hypothetical protein